MQACNEELIILDVEAENYEEAIRKVSALLYDGGYVKDTYTDAVIAREADFPTGLILKDINIAMPHTAGVHVNVPAVCVAKMAKPVVFGHMGDPDTKVPADILFMMAIKDPDAQIDTLQNVMSIFTNAEAIAELKVAKDKKTLFEVVSKYIG